MKSLSIILVPVFMGLFVFAALNMAGYINGCQVRARANRAERRRNCKE